MWAFRLKGMAEIRLSLKWVMWHCHVPFNSLFSTIRNNSRPKSSPSSHRVSLYSTSSYLVSLPSTVLVSGTLNSAILYFFWTTIPYFCILIFWLLLVIIMHVASRYYYACSEPKLLLLVIIMHVASYIIKHALFMCRVVSLFIFLWLGLALLILLLLFILAF